MRARSVVILLSVFCCASLHAQYRLVSSTPFLGNPLADEDTPTAFATLPDDGMAVGGFMTSYRTYPTIARFNADGVLQMLGPFSADVDFAGLRVTSNGLPHLLLVRENGTYLSAYTGSSIGILPSFAYAAMEHRMDRFSVAAQYNGKLHVKRITEGPAVEWTSIINVPSSSRPIEVLIDEGSNSTVYCATQGVITLRRFSSTGAAQWTLNMTNNLSPAQARVKSFESGTTQTAFVDTAAGIRVIEVNDIGTIANDRLIAGQKLVDAEKLGDGTFALFAFQSGTGHLTRISVSQISPIATFPGETTGDLVSLTDQYALVTRDTSFGLTCRRRSLSESELTTVSLRNGPFYIHKADTFDAGSANTVLGVAQIDQARTGKDFAVVRFTPGDSSLLTTVSSGLGAGVSKMIASREGGAIAVGNVNATFSSFDRSHLAMVNATGQPMFEVQPMLRQTGGVWDMSLRPGGGVVVVGHDDQDEVRAFTAEGEVEWEMYFSAGYEGSAKIHSANGNHLVARTTGEYYYVSDDGVLIRQGDMGTINAACIMLNGDLLFDHVDNDHRLTIIRPSNGTTVRSRIVYSMGAKVRIVSDNIRVYVANGLRLASYDKDTLVEQNTIQYDPGSTDNGCFRLVVVDGIVQVTNKSKTVLLSDPWTIYKSLNIGSTIQQTVDGGFIGFGWHDAGFYRLTRYAPDFTLIGSQYTGTLGDLPIASRDGNALFMPRGRLGYAYTIDKWEFQPGQVQGQITGLYGESTLLSGTVESLNTQDGTFTRFLWDGNEFAQGLVARFNEWGPSTMSVSGRSSCQRPGTAGMVSVIDSVDGRKVRLASWMSPLAVVNWQGSGTVNPSRTYDEQGYCRLLLQHYPINDEEPSTDGWVVSVDSILLSGSTSNP